MSVPGPWKICGLLASLLAANACVVSLEPYVAEPDALADPRLVGRWGGGDALDAGSALITQLSEKLYGIDFSEEDGRQVRLEARLGRWGERAVLDVWPTTREGEIPDTYRELMLPTHYLYVMDIVGDELRLGMPNPDSLRTALRRGELELSHRNTTSHTVLLGGSAELRAGLVAYLAKPGIIGDTLVLTRRAEP